VPADIDDGHAGEWTLMDEYCTVHADIGDRHAGVWPITCLLTHIMAMLWSCPLCTVPSDIDDDHAGVATYVPGDIYDGHAGG
jgi:hypothetical protein